MARSGSRTSSPSVAIRAYPANAKKSRPAAVSTPCAPTSTGAVSRSAVTCGAPVTATTASTVSTTATRIRVAVAVLPMPRRFTAVTATTARTATSRARPGHR